jgi:hypothetical protein
MPAKVAGMATSSIRMSGPDCAGAARGIGRLRALFVVFLVAMALPPLA